MPCSNCKLSGHNILKCKNIKNAKDLNYSQFWHSVCMNFINFYKGVDKFDRFVDSISYRFRQVESACSLGGPYSNKTFSAEITKNIIFKEFEHALYQYCIDTPYTIRKEWENTKEKNKKKSVYNYEWYEKVLEDYDYLKLPEQPISKWGKRKL